METKPLIVLDDQSGPAGNTVAILMSCERVARAAGWPKSTIDAFRREALSLDREHFMDMVFECFAVVVPETTYSSADRDSVR